MRRVSLILLLLIPCTGCGNLMHNLQPHRLWRMNYTDNSGRSDGSFLSVDDPLDLSLPAAEDNPVGASDDVVNP